jgi:hypothetical protein
MDKSIRLEQLGLELEQLQVKVDRRTWSCGYRHDDDCTPTIRIAARQFTVDTSISDFMAQCPAGMLEAVPSDKLSKSHTTKSARRRRKKQQARQDQQIDAAACD